MNVEPDDDLCGYLSPAYAASFNTFGEITTLPNSRIPLIRRKIVDEKYDLIGLYPYTMSSAWRGLENDIETLEQTSAVSVTFVGDPFEFNSISRACLTWDVCRKFKTHFVVQLEQDWRSRYPKTVRQAIKRGRRKQQVALVASGRHLAPLLWEVYLNTIRRHQLTGIQKLSEHIIADQLDVPGAMMIEARDDQGIVGAALVFQHGETANGHLLFLSDRAHGNYTSYVLIDTALGVCASKGCKAFNLGGPAGLDDNDSDGLYRFKAQWTDVRRSSTLCGKILDSTTYDSLSNQANAHGSNYFPVYRTLGSAFAL